MWQYFLQGRAWATGGHYYPILQMRKLGWGGKWPRTISDPDREVRTGEGACPQASTCPTVSGPHSSQSCLIG